MKALGEFFAQVGAPRIALVILFLSVFVDITPFIKINPIKAIFKYLGKAFNSSVEKEISNLKVEINGQIDEVKKEQRNQRETLDKLIIDNSIKELGRLRWAIIDFKNGLDNGNKYTREQYHHIFDSIDKYNEIIDLDEDVSDDEYFHIVEESGESIKDHFEEHRDDPVLYF